VTYQEHSPKAHYLGEGLFATLRAFICAKESGVPSYRRSFLLVFYASAILALTPGFALARDAHHFSSAFGSAGSGAGQLALRPFSDGKFVQPEPPQVAGSGLAVNAANGDLYIADTGNHRIDQFSASGVFTRSWGWGVENGSSELQTCTTATGCQAGLPGAEPGQLAEPTFIAIDNSCAEQRPPLTGIACEAFDPSAGDVYVADSADDTVSKFSPSGSLISSWGVGGRSDGSTATAPIAGPFGPIAGITANSSGDLWVYDENHHMFEFGQDGTFITDWDSGRGEYMAGIAADSIGDLYVFNGRRGVSKYTATGTEIGEVSNTFGGRSQEEDFSGVALDPLSDDVFVDNVSRVTRFSSSCEPIGGEGPEHPNCALIEAFGSPQPAGGELDEAVGIAVSATHAVYLANVGRQRIAVFSPFFIPDATAGTASAITTSGATISGSVNPDGIALKEGIEGCRFEYGETEQYDQTAACSPDPAGIGAATEPVEVHADLADLAANRFYHYRLAVANANGAGEGLDSTFTTLPGPEPSINCPANEQLRAENNSFALPDCRAYELVSPPEGSGEVYVPQHFVGQTLNSYSEYPYRAAGDGGAVSYAGDPPPIGGTGNVGGIVANQFLATRTPAGWRPSVISPTGSHQQTEYESFSADLTQGILWAAGSDRLSTFPPANCNVLYTHTGTEGDTGYQPLFTETQTPEATAPCGSPLFVGASADNSQLFFQTEAALIPGAPQAAGQGTGGRCERNCNLYQSAGGKLRLVNILPGPGEKPDPNAAFGAPPSAGNPPDFSNVISADGSRAFWTDTSTGKVYVREGLDTTEPSTVQVSTGNAQFWTATPDGRYAYYTQGSALFSFDLRAEPGQQRKTIVPAADEAQGVIGVNETGEDGSYIYFVASGALPGTSAVPRVCEVGEREEEVEQEHGSLPAGFGCNVYLLHNGETKFIAALSALDNRFDERDQRRGLATWPWLAHR